MFLECYCTNTGMVYTEKSDLDYGLSLDCIMKTIISMITDRCLVGYTHMRLSSLLCFTSLLEVCYGYFTLFQLLYVSCSGTSSFAFLLEPCLAFAACH